MTHFSPTTILDWGRRRCYHNSETLFLNAYRDKLIHLSEPHPLTQSHKITPFSHKVLCTAFLTLFTRNLNLHKITPFSHKVLWTAFLTLFTRIFTTPCLTLSTTISENVPFWPILQGISDPILKSPYVKPQHVQTFHYKTPKSWKIHTFHALPSQYNTFKLFYIAFQLVWYCPKITSQVNEPPFFDPFYKDFWECAFLTHSIRIFNNHYFALGHFTHYQDLFQIVIPSSINASRIIRCMSFRLNSRSRNSCASQTSQHKVIACQTRIINTITQIIALVGSVTWYSITSQNITTKYQNRMIRQFTFHYHINTKMQQHAHKQHSKHTTVCLTCIGSDLLLVRVRGPRHPTPL